MTEARRLEIIKAFLRYSFRDIVDEGYSGLTETEQEICTEEEWLELKAWAFQEENNG